MAVQGKWNIYRFPKADEATLLQPSVALRSFSMLFYMTKCVKEVKKLACEAIIPSVPKCLVNTERS